MKDTPKKTNLVQKNIPDPLPAGLYNIIACPVDKADLKYTHDKKGLQCVKCKYVYPIKEGIPILLPPELQDKP